MKIKNIFNNLGLLSALGIGFGYILITLIYMIVGAVPNEGLSALGYFSKHTQSWWWIIILSIFTDILFIPLTFCLYKILKANANKLVLILGLILMNLFVILDLVITWPNYFKLVQMSQQSSLEPSVNSANTILQILKSPLLSVYIILFPSLSILFFSLGLKGLFGKVIKNIGIAIGVLGTVAVVGGVYIPSLEILSIVNSILTLIWCLLLGFKFNKIKGSKYE